MNATSQLHGRPKLTTLRIASHDGSLDGSMTIVEGMCSLDAVTLDHILQSHVSALGLHVKQTTKNTDWHVEIVLSQYFDETPAGFYPDLVDLLRGRKACLVQG